MAKVVEGTLCQGSGWQWRVPYARVVGGNGGYLMPG